MLLRSFLKNFEQSNDINLHKSVKGLIGFQTVITGYATQALYLHTSIPHHQVRKL